MNRLRLAGCFFALMLLISCSLSRWTPPPLPSRIERLEGYASLRVRGEGGTAKSKFSFLFELPHQGRIDVTSVLGKTIYQIFIEEKQAFLVIPSKRVYWQGEEEEIIDKFFGFRLCLEDLVSLFSGQWKRSGRDSGESWREGWVLEKDGQGRIIRGFKEDLIFEVEEFFKNSSVIRLLTFRHPLSSGRLKILAINFNQPLKERVFALIFLKKYKRKTWAEIEEMLDEKN